jgi:hypothetical protein
MNFEWRSIETADKHALTLLGLIRRSSGELEVCVLFWSEFSSNGVLEVSEGDNGLPEIPEWVTTCFLAEVIPSSDRTLLGWAYPSDLILAEIAK